MEKMLDINFGPGIPKASVQKKYGLLGGFSNLLLTLTLQYTFGLHILIYLLIMSLRKMQVALNRPSSLTAHHICLLVRGQGEMICLLSSYKHQLKIDNL